VRSSNGRKSKAGVRKPARAAKAGASAAIALPRWPNTGVLVADGGDARILQATRRLGTSGRGSIDLVEIAHLQNAAAHLPGRALVTDRTGRVFDSTTRTGAGPRSHARHGANSEYDPHDAEVERFARTVARKLDAERRRLGIEELILIAGPRFLGVLRQQIPPATRKLVTREIDSDLVHANDAAIRKTAFARARAA